MRNFDSVLGSGRGARTLSPTDTLRLQLREVIVPDLDAAVRWVNSNQVVDDEEFARELRRSAAAEAVLGLLDDLDALMRTLGPHDLTAELAQRAFDVAANTQERVFTDGDSLRADARRAALVVLRMTVAQTQHRERITARRRPDGRPVSQVGAVTAVQAWFEAPPGARHGALFKALVQAGATARP